MKVLLVIVVFFTFCYGSFEIYDSSSTTIMERQHTEDDAQINGLTSKNKILVDRLLSANAKLIKLMPDKKEAISAAFATEVK